MGDVRINIEQAIKDPQLKLFANAVDRTCTQAADKSLEPDGDLVGEEIRIFAEGAKKHYGATDADLEAMGIKLTKTTTSEESSKATETAVTTNPVSVTPEPQKTFTEKEQKRFHKDVRKAVKELVKQGISNDDLLSTIKTRFAMRNGSVGIVYSNGQPIIQQEYRAAIKEFEEVLSKIDFSKITDKKDVKGFEKEVLSKLPNTTSFQKDVVGILKDSAEASAIGKRSFTLHDKFVKELGSGHNFQKAVDAVEASLKKDKTDYNKDALKEIESKATELAVEYVRDIMETADLIGHIKTEKNYMPKLRTDLARVQAQLMSETNEARKANLEKTKSQIEARIKDAEELFKKLPEYEKEVPYADALNAAEGKVAIRAILREKLGASKDKYIADAIQELKFERKIMARGNKVENAYEQSVSDKEMVHKIKVAENGISRGKFIKQYTLITSITHESTKHAQELYTKLCACQDFFNADGSFNEQTLSEFIMKYVSPENFRLDREDRDFNASELKNLMDALSIATGKEITKSEAKALVKMCEYQIQHKNYLKALGMAAAGGVITAATGAIGGFLADAGVMKVTQSVNLKIEDSKMLANTLKQLDEQNIKYEKIDLTKGHAYVKILQQVIIPSERTANTITGLINGLPFGVALGALAGMIWGDDISELTCIPTSVYDNQNTLFTDPERFKNEFIPQHFKKNVMRRKAFQVMVDKYVQQYGKDNWHAALWQDLREAGGFGSDLDPEECRRFFSHIKVRNVNNNNNTTESSVRIEAQCEKRTTTTTKVEFPRLQSQQDWGVMAEKYDCLKANHPEIYGSHRVKTRYMKAIQAIKKADSYQTSDGKTVYGYKLTNIKKYVDVSLGVKLKGKGHEREDVQNLTMAFNKAIAAGIVNPDEFNVTNFINLIVYAPVTAQKIPTIIDDTNNNTTCEYNKNKKVAYTKVGSWKGTPTGPDGDTSTNTTVSGKDEANVIDNKTNKVLHTTQTEKEARKWAADKKLKVTNVTTDCPQGTK